MATDEQVERFAAALLTDHWSARERTLPQLLGEMDGEDPAAILSHAVGRFAAVYPGLGSRAGSRYFVQNVGRVLEPHFDRFPYLSIFVQNVLHIARQEDEKRERQRKKGSPEQKKERKRKMENTQQFDRFREAPWFSERPEQVLVGGAGGIGSWLALFLARAGFEPTVHDHDTVEAHNLGGQMYHGGDIGHEKVIALQRTVALFGPDRISTSADRITEAVPGHHFAFSAFDSMEARRAMFRIWKRASENCPVAPLLVDGRLAMEQMQVFCVTPATMAEYEEEHLFADGEVEDLPCSLRQTTHSAAMVAAVMTGMFTNHIANIRERRAARSVPFFYEHFIPLALTEVR